MELVAVNGVLAGTAYLLSQGLIIPSPDDESSPRPARLPHSGARRRRVHPRGRRRRHVAVRQRPAALGAAAAHRRRSPAGRFPVHRARARTRAGDGARRLPGVARPSRADASSPGSGLRRRGALRRRRRRAQGGSRPGEADARRGRADVGARAGGDRFGAGRLHPRRGAGRARRLHRLRRQRVDGALRLVVGRQHGARGRRRDREARVRTADGRRLSTPAAGGCSPVR